MSRGASHARITAFSFLRRTDNGHTGPAIIPEANIPGLAPVLCLGRADVVQGDRPRSNVNGVFVA